MRDLTSIERRDFVKLFEIPTNTKNDVDNFFFNNLMEFRWSKSNKRFPVQSFFDFLYVDDINSYNKEIENLDYNITKRQLPYHFVHSYGKNGKSVFIESFIHKKKNKFSFFNLDFKVSSGLNNKLDFQEKCVLWIIDRYKKNRDIFYANVRLLNSILNQETPTQGTPDYSYYNDFHAIFDTWFYRFIEFVDNCESQTENKNYFQQNFKPLIKNWYKSNLISDSELFSFLIIISILSFTDSDKRSIIILDNLDDVFDITIELLGSDFIPHVDNIIELIKQNLPDDLDYEYNISRRLSNIHYIFIYRTANYVSTLTQLKLNSSKIERNRKILKTPKYSISSIKRSNSILKRKLQFYDHLCSTFAIEHSPKRHAFENLIDSFNSIRLEDHSYVFRLWNGNRQAFFRCFENIDNEETIENISADSFPKKLKRGIFIYYAMSHYLSNQTLDAGSSMSTSLDYFIQSHDLDSKTFRCNLFRLFCSQIINKQPDSKNIKNNYDIFKFGVSLFDLLNAFALLKLKKNEPYYDADDFKKMFSNIFHSNIDEWGHFLTCVTNKSRNDETEIIRKYNFDKEIDLWFKKKRKPESFRKIRFYANTNCKYFLIYVKRHFEYFSASVDSTNEPLSSGLKIFHSVPTHLTFERYLFKNPKKFEAFELPVSFSINKHEHILSTIDKVRSSCYATVSFYKKGMRKHWKPFNYCLKSDFALKETFYFADVVSRQIAYINRVRNEYVKSRLGFKIQTINNSNFESKDVNNKDLISYKRIINIYCAFYIKQLLEIFDTCYSKISERIETQYLNPQLLAAKRSFNGLKLKLNDLFDSDFKDFRITIQND